MVQVIIDIITIMTLETNIQYFYLLIQETLITL